MLLKLCLIQFLAEDTPGCIYWQYYYLLKQGEKKSELFNEVQRQSSPWSSLWSLPFQVTMETLTVGKEKLEAGLPWRQGMTTLLSDQPRFSAPVRG